MVFRSDGLSVLYGETLVRKLNSQWTEKWMTVVLDMIGFLSDKSISTDNIRALESLMLTIDAQTKQIFIIGDTTELLSTSRAVLFASLIKDGSAM